MKNNLLVILLGPPGSGKGTQSLLLAERKGMLHVEASKSLEAKFRKASPGEEIVLGGEKFSLDEQRRRWEGGLLCEDRFVAEVMKERLDALQDLGESVIIDGYPRSVRQIESILPFLKEKYGSDKILVISISVEEDDSIYRNKNRRVCRLMRHSILSHPETVNLTICPVDGSELEKRKLDDPETIKVRLKEFKELSFPVFNYFRENGVKVEEIDGKGSISDVFSRILKAVENI